MEEYEEIDSEFTVNDYVFIGSGILAGCLIMALIFKLIRKTFKNIHLKIGNKIEIGVETK